MTEARPGCGRGLDRRADGLMGGAGGGAASCSCTRTGGAGLLVIGDLGDLGDLGDGGAGCGLQMS
jgi:hypothetical protein